MFLSDIQKEDKVYLKEVYGAYYHQMVGAVSDEQVCQSLVDQLRLSAVIPDEKIAQLSSSKVTGSSFLKTLGLEEETHLLVPLVSAMSRVEQLQTLAKEMTTVLKQGTCTHMHGSMLIACFTCGTVGIAQDVEQPLKLDATGEMVP